MSKITYTELVLNGEFHKEVMVDGIEINAQSDMADGLDWGKIVEYFNKLFDMGLVDRVVENTLCQYTNLIVITELPDGGQYHRVFTKWNN